MNHIYKQRLSLLSTMNELNEEIFNNKTVAAESLSVMKEALLAIGVHPKSQMLNLIDMLANGQNVNHEFCVLFEKFYDAQIIAAGSSATVSSSFETKRLGCDRQFLSYYELFKNNSLAALISLVNDNFAELKKNDPKTYELLLYYSSHGWFFENDELLGVGKSNSLINHRMTVLKENIDKIAALYNMLADNKSRETLNSIFDNWLTFSTKDFFSCADCTREAVDVNLFPIYSDEVFVDCGSFIGDTVFEYVSKANSDYKRVYTYDISAETVNQMKANLSHLNNIVFNVKGVGEFNDTLEIYGTNNPHEGNKLVKSGGNTSTKVPVVKLDDDIKEPITFLKIDVEGLDKETIRGAREHIQRTHPKLAIDAYHKLADFFEIPLLIREIDPSYVIYLRIASKVEMALGFPRPSIYAL